MSEKTTDTKVEEKVDTTTIQDESTEETTDAETVDESTEEGSEKTTDTDDADYEAELEKERKGKPDPKKAKDAFKERQSKHQDDEEESDNDKPLTRREAEKILQEGRALDIANNMANSPKEAELIVEKWKNRTFPTHLSLTQQLEEAYAITHAKKLVGERNEAIRALKAKAGVNKNTATTHREPAAATEPKLSPADASGLKNAGFAFNGVSRRYEKKLSNGDMIIQDPKTKKTFFVKKSR